MIINPYTILVTLSVLVVLSYLFNYISSILKIPSVLLLSGSGIALKFITDLVRPPATTNKNAALNLSIERSKTAPDSTRLRICAGIEKPVLGDHPNFKHLRLIGGFDYHYIVSMFIAVVSPTLYFMGSCMCP
jgi:hypothetical protein